jgi:hypothetical protein
VERHKKMGVHISNTSWRFTALSPSRELPEKPYYSTVDVKKPGV